MIGSPTHGPAKLPTYRLSTNLQLFSIFILLSQPVCFGETNGGKQISFLCDNKSTVNILNKSRSDTPFTNCLIRRLTWICVNNNFILKATYLPHISNKADVLSHFKFQEFHARFPEAHPSSLPCPLSAKRSQIKFSFLIYGSSQYMRFGIAKSTLKACDSAWSYFSLFCTAFAVSAIPINMQVVCAFIVYSANVRKPQPLSIKATLAGIQFHLRCQDPNRISLFHHPSISLLMNGISKALPGKKD